MFRRPEGDPRQVEGDKGARFPPTRAKRRPQESDLGNGETQGATPEGWKKRPGDLSQKIRRNTHRKKKKHHTKNPGGGSVKRQKNKSKPPPEKKGEGQGKIQVLLEKKGPFLGEKRCRSSAPFWVMAPWDIS